MQRLQFIIKAIAAGAALLYGAERAAAHHRPWHVRKGKPIYPSLTLYPSEEMPSV